MTLRPDRPPQEPTKNRIFFASYLGTCRSDDADRDYPVIVGQLPAAVLTLAMLCRRLWPCAAEVVALSLLSGRLHPDRDPRQGRRSGALGLSVPARRAL